VLHWLLSSFSLRESMLQRSRNLFQAAPAGAPTAYRLYDERRPQKIDIISVGFSVGRADGRGEHRNGSIDDHRPAMPAQSASRVAPRDQ